MSKKQASRKAPRFRSRIVSHNPANANTAPSKKLVWREILKSYPATMAAWGEQSRSKPLVLSCTKEIVRDARE